MRQTARCRLTSRVLSYADSRILTLYSRMMPVWVLWGGGSQDTLILELLVSWTTDIACGAALKTADRDKKGNYISRIIMSWCQCSILQVFNFSNNVQKVSLKQVCNLIVSLGRIGMSLIKKNKKFGLYPIKYSSFIYYRSINVCTFDWLKGYNYTKIWFYRQKVKFISSKLNIWNIYKNTDIS